MGDLWSVIKKRLAVFVCGNVRAAASSAVPARMFVHSWCTDVSDCDRYPWLDAVNIISHCSSRHRCFICMPNDTHIMDTILHASQLQLFQKLA